MAMLPRITGNLHDALKELARVPAAGALYGRRSRRFPLGGEIPDGRWHTARSTSRVPLWSSSACWC